MPDPSPRTPAFAALTALLGLVWVAHGGLHAFELTDYAWEQAPAMRAFSVGDWSGYFSRLPAYGGAMLLEAPATVLRPLLGGSLATSQWRALAVPGLVLLGLLAVLAGGWVSRATPGRRGLVLGAFTAALVGGSPVARLAEQTGHPEEVLVAALVVLGVVRASGGHGLSAGVLVGLAAAGKPWALVAVPVVLVAADDRRQLVRTGVAILAAGLVLLAPLHLAGNATTVHAARASATATGIFKPSSVFWFLGRPNPHWAEVRDARTHVLKDADPSQAIWAQRLAPSWAGRVSHPGVVLAAFALAGLFRLRRRAPGARREDLLLLLAAVCWWRCLLDTWNVHYYALTAILALALWEARARRAPVLAAAATALLVLGPWPWGADTRSPDAEAALYLLWAVPLGVGLAARAVLPAPVALAGARVRALVEPHAPTLTRWLAPAAPLA